MYWFRQHIKQECPECGSIEIKRDRNRAEIICSACGLVIEDSIVDTGREWRQFEGESEKKERTGGILSPSLCDYGLRTLMGKKHEFHKIPRSRRSQYRRIKKWCEKYLPTAHERNMKWTFSELKRYVSALSLPKSVQETTAILYRKALERNLIKGRSSEALMLGTLYLVCRQQGYPRHISEFAEISNLSKREIARSYRFISREFGLKIQPANPTKYIPRFASLLGLSEKTQLIAYDFLKKHPIEKILPGREPKGTAIAALFYASNQTGEKFNQRDAARVSGITEVTLRTRCKELSAKLGIDIKTGRKQGIRS
jgi:transcription initiation factor TFIIB